MLSEFIYIAGLPTVTVIPATQSVEVTKTIVFTALVTGVGPFIYQWQKEGHNLSDEMSPLFVIYNASSIDQAKYSCYVSNIYGDTATSNIVMLQVTSMFEILQDIRNK